MKALVTKDLTTTSLDLAELFGKRHDHVLRTIRNAIKDMDEETRTLRKIGECFKINKLANNKPEPYFILGEEMTLVITGRFTGKDAFAVQMKLADAFIAMRNFIRNQSTCELEKFQAVLTQQAEELELFAKREPRDSSSLAVILDKPTRHVQIDHDLLERHGYLTSRDYWQKYTVKTPTAKLGNLCIGRKHNTLLYDPKIKELVRLLHETESLFN
jgi:Rha family phage regulatory protein